LEETDIPDLSEIMCFKNALSIYLPNTNLTQELFQGRMRTIYDIRCKIAHVKKSFTAIDLDLLSEVAGEFVPLLGTHGDELRTTLDCLKTNPSTVILHIPSDFIIDYEEISPIRNNLPASDYDPDGGFIGRKDELKKVKSLIFSDLDRVITIAGAGGVGKSALALDYLTE
jgi:LuxR family transcriptional regulator, glucitol operon activator